MRAAALLAIAAACTVAPVAAQLEASAKPSSVITLAMIDIHFPPWVFVDSRGTFYGGFLVELLKELALMTNTTIDLRPVGNRDPLWLEQVSNNMHELVGSGAVDVAWDPMTFVMREGYIYSLPLFHIEDAIILRREVLPPTIFEMFAPFDAPLWGTILASVVGGALAMHCITAAHVHGRGGPEKSFLSTFPTYVYHTFIALLGGDDFDEYHLPTGGRIFRFGLLFLALMVTATYTANLAAFLVRPKFEVYGPQTYDELSRATVCARWTTGTDPWEQYVKRVILPPTGMGVFEASTWSLEMMRNGSCDAILWTRQDSHLETLENCNTHYMPDIHFSPKPMMLVMDSKSKDLMRVMNNAILKVMMSPFYAKLVDRYFRYSEQCSDKVEELPQIGVTHMALPLMVFGVCCLLAVTVTIGMRAVRHEQQEMMEKEKHEVDMNARLDAKLDEVLRCVHSMHGGGGAGAVNGAATASSGSSSGRPSGVARSLMGPPEHTAESPAAAYALPPVASGGRGHRLPPIALAKAPPQARKPYTQF